MEELYSKLRAIPGSHGYSPIDIFGVVNGWKNMKITLIKYPMSDRISGMCTKEGKDIVICINSTSSYGRQRFTLAHELYHVLYEADMKRTICDMSMTMDKSDSEKEADIFASYLLVPYDALIQYEHEKGEWNLENVIAAEQFFQISHQAMIHRLVSDGRISSKKADEYRNITVSSYAAKMGYGKELYFSTEQGKKYFTTGEYIRKVEMLAEKELISNGKREELLLEAYRPDIVFDFDEGEAKLND